MFRTLDEADVKGKRVLVRVDLNVPVDNGKVADLTRIERVAPTLREIADRGGKVILMSLFGRPKGPDPTQSLKLFAPAIAGVLKRPVAFADDCIGEKAAAAVNAMRPGDILCLENTRFHRGEERNDPAFVAALAALGDIFVNDAFSVAHRAHASVAGLASRLPTYAGRTMRDELQALTKVLETPTRPLAAIVGGGSRPSSISSATCSPRWTASSSAAAWLTPFWPRSDIPWARRFASTSSRRRRAISWPRRRPAVARSCFRSTQWAPRSSGRGR